MLRNLLATMLVVGCTAAYAQMPKSASPDGANVYIVTPAHGAVVASPVTVRFGLSGMGVAPAGVEKAKTGHHHLLVDVSQAPPAGSPIPADDHHRHFGGGQTEVTVALAPGVHTLQLLLADHNHVPHQPPVMSEQITITVR